MFIKRLLIPFFAIFLLASLGYNCGGGGGSSVPQEEPPQPPISPESLSLISGYIYVGDNPNDYPDGLVSIISVISLDNDGREIDRKQISTQNGKFSLNVGLGKNGGSVVLTVNAEGYTPGTKTIPYTSPEDFKNLNIAIKIDPVLKKFISIQEIKVTSNEKVVKVNFFETPDGKITTQSSEGSKLKLSVAIPIEKLEEDTESLFVSYKSYEPSKPEDYQNFPGERTEAGNDLVSIGFFTLDIKDPKTGENPFKKGIKPALAKNQGEYYRILTYVDCEQIENLKKILGTLDENPEKEGIQLTFYAFDWDKGAWVEAGEGTFVSSLDVEYERFGENPDTIDTPWDYIIFKGCVNAERCTSTNINSAACEDVNGDNILEDVSCEGNYVITDENKICSQIKPVYVVVSVTNPELQWKNLDYIKPKSKKIKINVVAKDDEGKPLSIPVYIYDGGNECIASSSGYTSERDGKAQLETLKYCENPTIFVEYLNPFTQMYETYPQNPLPVNDGDTVNLTITNPLKCKVEGIVKTEDGKPKSGIPVTAYSNTEIFYRSVYTDENGTYSIPVLCETDLYLSTPYNTQSYIFNVDGNTGGDEDNDNGNIATLKPVIVKNMPPHGYGYLSTYSTKYGSTVYAYIYAWDIEGNTPIKYKLKVSNGNDTVLTYQGSINKNYGSNVVSINTGDLPGDGVYNISLILVDSGYTGNIGDLSQSYTQINVGNLVVRTENLPPIISYFYVTPSIVSKPGKTVTLYGYGYDIDTPQLSSQVKYRCLDNDGQLIDTGYTQNGNNLLIKGSEKFQIPNNKDIKICEFVWILNDGTEKVSSEPVVVEIKNRPPSVYIWPEEQIVSSEKTETNIYAIVSDPDGDEVSCRWYVNNVLDNDQTSCETYELDLTNFEAGDNITVKLEATDSNLSSSDEITIHYGKPANLDINIQ